MKKFLRASVLLPLSMALLVSCAKTRKAGGQMDTPEVH